MNYINHFGEQSANYLSFRPDYPDELYQYLATLTPAHDLTWDCGTGNGQAAVKLASYFKQVIATDMNQAQLDVALQAENIKYYCCSADQTQIADNSVDLITVAQALHWFNLDNFYEEARRVIKPGGIVAAWSYSLGKIDEKIDGLIRHLYQNILGDSYWAKERHYIDDGYRTLPFPFTKLNPPNFHIEKKLNFQLLEGYLNTWSAVKEYQRRNGKSPITLIYADLQHAWGESNKEYIMRWPLHLLIGQIK